MALTKSTVAVNNVSVLADEPALTSAQLKAVFDKYGSDDKTFTNALIDELESTTAGSSGAEQIGSASIAGVSGNSPHAQLADLKTQLTALVAGVVPNGSLEETMDADAYRDTAYTYNGSGLLTTVTYSLGGVPKKIVTFTYSGSYVSTVAVAIAGGDIITATLTYDVNNRIESITKVVS